MRCRRTADVCPCCSHSKGLVRCSRIVNAATMASKEVSQLLTDNILCGFSRGISHTMVDSGALHVFLHKIFFHDTTNYNLDHSKSPFASPLSSFSHKYKDRLV
jgi:hypothetical protein